eukprot:37949_1
MLIIVLEAFIVFYMMDTLYCCMNNFSIGSMWFINVNINTLEIIQKLQFITVFSQYPLQKISEPAQTFIFIKIHLVYDCRKLYVDWIFHILMGKCSKLPRQYTVLPSSDENRIRAYYTLCVND